MTVVLDLDSNSFKIVFALCAGPGELLADLLLPFSSLGCPPTPSIPFKFIKVIIDILGDLQGCVIIHHRVSFLLQIAFIG